MYLVFSKNPPAGFQILSCKSFLLPLSSRAPRGSSIGILSHVSFQPSASERRNLWQNPARVLYSLFGNTDCIQPSRGGAKTRSTSRRLCRRSAQGDTKWRLRRPAGGSALNDKKVANRLLIIKLRVRKPRFFVGAFGCSLALLLRGNARMRTLLFLFPKSHFVAIFGSPFSATPFGNTLPFAGKVKPHDFYNGVPRSIVRRGKPPLSRA